MTRITASLLGLACLAGCTRNEPPRVETVRVLVPVVVKVPVPAHASEALGDELPDYLSFRLAVAGANLANLETPGYKPLFAAGRDESGHPIAEFWFAQGAPRTERRPLDILVNGAGFFRVSADEGGFLYTRDGRFTRNCEGELVMVDAPGYRLEPQIAVPPEAVGLAIDADGMVTCTDCTGQKTELGRISVFGFSNTAGLVAAGGVFFSETANSGEPLELEGIARPTLVQFYYEGSAVDAEHERREVDEVRRRLPPVDGPQGTLSKR